MSEQPAEPGLVGFGDLLCDMEAALANLTSLAARCGHRSDLVPWFLHQAESALSAAIKAERRVFPDDRPKLTDRIRKPRTRNGMKTCPECKKGTHSSNRICTHCGHDYWRTPEPSADSVRCSALVLLHARWLAEAEASHELAKKAREEGSMSIIHVTRAMMLERCASELDGAGMKENK